MATPGRRNRPPTLADLDALPPGIVGEIIEGVLHTQPHPYAVHQHTMTVVASSVAMAFDSHRDSPWWIVHRLPIEPPGALEIRPDVVGWLRTRMPKIIDGPISLVPDWVCEVVSAQTRRLDLEIKVPFYAKIGVPYLWLIDLDERMVIARKLVDGRYETTGRYRTETDARIEPFEIVPFDVNGWWIPSDLLGAA